MLSTAASNALLKTLEEPPGPRGLRAGHHRRPEGAAHHPQPDPALRVPASRARHPGRAAAPDPRRGRPRPGRRRRSTPPSAGAGVRPATPCRRSTRWRPGVPSTTSWTCWPSPGRRPGRARPGPALVVWPRPPRPATTWPELAGALADHLRQAFLASVAPDLVAVPGTERAQVEELARKMGLPGRGPTHGGPGQGPGRHARGARSPGPPRGGPDPPHPSRSRRLARRPAGADRTPRAGPGRRPAGRRSGGAPAAAAPPPSRGAGPWPAPRPGPDRHRRPDGAGIGGRRPADPTTPTSPDPNWRRRALRDAPRRCGGGPVHRRRPPAAPARPPTPGAGASPPTGAGPARRRRHPPARGGRRRRPTVSRDELVQLWGDGLLASLPGRARARFRVGRFVAVEDGTAVFALPNETHRPTAKTSGRGRAALGDHFGTPSAAAGGRRRRRRSTARRRRRARAARRRRHRSAAAEPEPDGGTAATCSTPSSWPPRRSRPGRPLARGAAKQAFPGAEEV